MGFFSSLWMKAIREKETLGTFQVVLFHHHAIE